MAVNLASINERFTALMAELGRLQREIEKELNALNAPATVQITQEEYDRLRGTDTTATKSASDAAAVQSAAMGNTDPATQAKAAKAEETAKSK